MLKQNVLKNHTEAVYAVAWSLDGTKLASGSGDHSIILWDVACGTAIGALAGHTNHVRSVAWTTDGTKLASGSFDSTAIVWDPKSGAVVTTLKGHNNAINAVSWNPRAFQLATASDDKTIIVWDVARSSSLTTFKGHTENVFSVAWSPDGTKLASGSYDNTAIIWDVARGVALAKLKDHVSSVYCVAWRPDGTKLATGSVDKLIKLWDVSHPTAAVGTLNGHSDKVRSVAWSPDGTQLASAGDDNAVIVWDAARGVALATLKGHTYIASCVAWRPDGAKLASGSWDKTIIVWGKGGTGDPSSTPPSSVPIIGSTTAATASGRGNVGSEAELRGQLIDLQHHLDLARKAQHAAEHSLAVIKKERDEALAELRHLQQHATAPYSAGAAYNLHGINAQGPDGSRQPCAPGDRAEAYIRRLLKSRGTFLPVPSPVAGLQLVNVELIRPDSRGIEGRINRLTQLRAGGGTLFNPPNSQLDAEQLQLLIALKDLFEPRDPTWAPSHPNLLHVFHGTRIEALDSACLGLVAVRATDAGFFGLGVYTTPNIEYAARYALGEFDPPNVNGQLPPPRTRRADGCVPVIMACAVVGVSHPVTRHLDYSAASDPHSKFFGKPLLQGFDTHVAAVSAAAAYEAVPRKEMQYMELVIDQESQVLPIAVLWIKEL